MLLKVTREDGATILLRQESICTIENDNGRAKITMSNGKEILIIAPPYEQWEADLFIQ